MMRQKLDNSLKRDGLLKVIQKNEKNQVTFFNYKVKVSAEDLNMIKLRYISCLLELNNNDEKVPLMN